MVVRTCRLSVVGSFYATFYEWYLFSGARPATCAVRNTLKSRPSRSRTCIRGYTSDFKSGRAPVVHDETKLHRLPDSANHNAHPDLSTHMRHLMRRIPHSAVVVTAGSGLTTPGEPLESSFRGMTVSSFNTVALSPTPLVSFNIKTPSATYSAISASGTFLVHMLHASVAGAHICDVFARGNNGTGQAFQRLVSSSSRDESAVKVFSGKGTNGSPLVAGAGVMRVLKCRILPGKELRVGEHIVLIGEVLSILSPPGSSPSSWRENQESEGRTGLVYADRKFRRLGEEITLVEQSAPHSSSVDFEASVKQTTSLNIRRGDEHF